MLDTWRGQAAGPWHSRQEAAQHVRRAFAFLDNVGDGRVNMVRSCSPTPREPRPLSPLHPTPPPRAASLTVIIERIFRCARRRCVSRRRSCGSATRSRAQRRGASSRGSTREPRASSNTRTSPRCCGQRRSAAPAPPPETPHWVTLRALPGANRTRDSAPPCTKRARVSPQ